MCISGTTGNGVQMTWATVVRRLAARGEKWWGGGGGVGTWGPATHYGPKASTTATTTASSRSSGNDEQQAHELISGVIRLLVELRCVDAWKADAAADTVRDAEGSGVSEGLEEEEQLELSLRDPLHMDYDIFRHRIDVALMRAITASHSIVAIHGDTPLPSAPDGSRGSNSSTSSRACTDGGGYGGAVRKELDRGHHGWLDMEVDLEDWAFFLHGERNRQEREWFISAAADKEEQQTTRTEAEAQAIRHQSGFLRGLFG